MLQHIGQDNAIERVRLKGQPRFNIRVDNFIEPAPRLVGMWDYWEREMDDLAKGHSMREHFGGKHIIITGASSGIGRAAGLKLAAAGAVPLLVVRNVDKLEEVRAEIVAAGGTAYVYQADLADMDSIERLLERVLADHRNIDGLVNNAGRSIRRSIALSYERFHDFERTMQLNYFGAVKMIIGLLPHMRVRGSGHIVNVSSIGVQANPPRFSAYVASKAALMRSRAWSPRRCSATASPSPRSTCRWCARR
jgi:hypothetical protein